MFNPSSRLLLSLLKPIASPVAGFLFKKIQAGVNRAELEIAIQAGLIAAIEQEEKLPLKQRLFDRSAPDRFKKVPGFVLNFFNNEKVQKELTQPFLEKKWISVDDLVDEFKYLAQIYQKVKPLENRIEPWLKAFTDAYFQKTPAYYNFQDLKKKVLRAINKTS